MNDHRVTARIRREADGSLYREYVVGQMAYGSLAALRAAQEGR